MKNNVLKTIIKHLAKSNNYAAQQAINELQTETERDEARRIFAALKIETGDKAK